MGINPFKALSGIGTAKTFWDTIRNVSAKSVAEEADLGFKLALVGYPADRDRFREALLTNAATVTEQDEAAGYLRDFDAAPDADLSKAFAFTIYVPAGEETRIGARSAGGAPIEGNFREIVEEILRRRPDLSLALARRFPAFRKSAAQQIIRETSRINAQFALLSALPAILPPVLGIFLPASSIADSIILTKNQVMMIMRLAAAHGREPGYGKQAKEILGTVGAAFGWRTLARETVGLIPFVGPVMKSAIAYSGTFTAGQSALYFYQTGTFATPAQIRAIYQGSKTEAQRVASRLKKKEPVSEPEPQKIAEP